MSKYLFALIIAMLMYPIKICADTWDTRNIGRPKCNICDNSINGGIYCIETWSDTALGEEAEKKKVCGKCYIKIKLFVADLGKEKQARDKERFQRLLEELEKVKRTDN